jgi:hypothetical protein
MIMYFFVYGGLGNQMFQLAASNNLQWHSEKEVRLIDMTPFFGRRKVGWELDRFDIKPHRVSYFFRLILYVLSIFFRYAQKVFPNISLVGAENEYMLAVKKGAPISFIYSGYFQGLEFFESVETEIGQLFGHSQHVSQPQDKYSVAVHLRRGDYVTDPIAKDYHLVCTDDWYRKAMSYIASVKTNAHFYLFSDDVEWASLHFSHSPNCTVMKKSSDAYLDLLSMSQMDGLIISNSSFSWWSQFLCTSSDKMIVVPHEWFSGVAVESLPIYNDKWIVLS